MAIDAAIYNDYSFVLRFVATPHIVFAYEPTKILAPHRSMQGADHLDVECSCFLQYVLNLNSVFPNDVDVVAASFC